MEIVQPIPTRAKIARAWLEHAHSFDRCVGATRVFYIESREDPGNEVGYDITGSHQSGLCLRCVFYFPFCSSGFYRDANEQGETFNISINSVSQQNPNLSLQHSAKRL